MHGRRRGASPGGAVRFPFGIEVGRHKRRAGGSPVKRDVDPWVFLDPERFAEDGYPHDVWTLLRAASPVARFEPEGYRPFLALTRQAEILQVSSRPDIFSSTQGIVLAPAKIPIVPTEMIVSIDPPRHGPLRRAASRRFTPRAVSEERAEIGRIVGDLLDDVATAGGTEQCDFVERIAAPLPIAVISWVLGVPPGDWRLLFRWTNEIIGKDDPEFRRPGESPGQTFKRARGELRGYLSDLIARRRAAPTGDLISELSGAEVGGEPLDEEQLLSYCELLVEAGNETTRNAISGGLLAFAEFPEQWEALRARPELVPVAVEEILRWVSPIIHFTRTATVDTEVGGQRIRAGEQVALFYASANRDETVFDDPFAFRVDRRPNPHMAFGVGEHFCLGAHVARVEIEAVIRGLVERLSFFELAGRPERLRSHVNGGIKKLPLSYRLK